MAPSLDLPQVDLMNFRVEYVRRSNFCKDHRDKIEVPDPVVVEDLISDKLNNRRK